MLVYRPIEVWPGAVTNVRKAPPFTATWTETQRLLGRELDQLRVDSAVVQLALTESDLRIDGTIRANAKLSGPGVILSFETAKHGKLSYPCDTFDGGSKWRSGRGSERGGYRDIPGWQVNLRAIALGLEALRKVERYGIAQRGEQYTGWKAIGAGTPLGPIPRMTAEEAARFIAVHAVGSDAADSVVRNGVSSLLAGEGLHYYRHASKALHPDTGAFDEEAFKTLQEAWRTLNL